IGECSIHVCGDATEKCMTRKRTPGSLWRGLPDDRITTDHRERRIPSPHRHREIEGGNHSDWAQRMPLLHHAVRSAFTRHRDAGELPAETYGEIPNIDHLLHFTESFLINFTALPSDNRCQILLVFAKFEPKSANALTPHGCRDHAELGEAALSPLYGQRHIAGRMFDEHA